MTFVLFLEIAAFSARRYSDLIIVHSDFLLFGERNLGILMAEVAV